jgi:hypothetical protein
MINERQTNTDRRFDGIECIDIRLEDNKTEKMNVIASAVIDRVIGKKYFTFLNSNVVVFELR